VCSCRLGGDVWFVRLFGAVLGGMCRWLESLVRSDALTVKIWGWLVNWDDFSKVGRFCALAVFRVKLDSL